MPICEICGTDSPRAKRVFLEGSLLMLCQKCAKFGQVKEEEKRPALPRRAPAPYTGSSKQGDAVIDKGEMVLVEDFHKVISDARNRLGLTQDELAKKINEKKSVIAKLEGKQLRPNEKLRKKLERFLIIALTEKVMSGGFQMREEKKGVTIGDMIKMSKKK